MGEIYYNTAPGKWELVYDFPKDMFHTWLSVNTKIDSIKMYAVADSSDSHCQEENDELEMSFDDLFE